MLWKDCGLLFIYLFVTVMFTCSFSEEGDHLNGYSYVEEFKGFIKFKMYPAPWYDAREKCKAENGDLVTIDTDKKSRAIISRIQPHNYSEADAGFWIGANDRRQEGSFVWANGTPLNYSRWATGNPDSWSVGVGLSNNVDCVLTGDGEYGKWYDRDCSFHLRFICEAHSKKCSSTCLTYVEPYKTCIQLHAIPKSWEGAKGQCEGGNGKMLVVDSPEKHEAITQKIKNLRMIWWIGGRLKVGGKFEWTNRIEFDATYTNWGLDRPNGLSTDGISGGDCAVMNYTSSPRGHWNDVDCNLQFNYICESPTVL